MVNKISEKEFKTAKKFIPGGVNSPVRAWNHVNMDPVIIKSGEGSKLIDVDGNSYIDYICSYGPLILGHTNEKVMNSVTEALENGTSFGSTSVNEILLCKEIVNAFPSIEKVRLVNSGTEATMSAIRLARAYTKKNIIVKFEGCYHGHADSFLSKAGSGLLTQSISSSPGVPEETAKYTVNCEYNDIDSVKEVFKTFSNEIAAVILEPYPANMGLVLPEENFLHQVEEITKNNKSLLIFDEVISGFRYQFGGIQNKVNIKPDLTTLGKIIGGGFPIGAFGGKDEIMNMLAPVGEVYQAGTLSGNPIAASAGYATLQELKSPSVYSDLEMMTEQLTFGIHTILSNKNIPHTINECGSVFSVFFTDGPVKNFKDVMKTSSIEFEHLFKNLFDMGIMIPPSPYEVCFVSTAHSQKDINETLISLEKSVY